MSQSQKEAVFQAVETVLEEAGRTIVDGQPVQLATEERKTVISLVANGMVTGAVRLSADAQAKYDTPDKVSAYASSMVGNWLRKDERLNGGTKHVIQNPGSRAGSKDAVLKNLQLLAQRHASNPEAMAKVNAAIETRKAEIAATKVKPVTIDLEAIPEHLRDLL